MNPPLISVIIPTKNRIKELKRSIESVLKQTHTNFEVFVVDDKSEEDIQGLVKSFQDDKIIYFLNDQNISNANVCRNIGIEHSKGEYIAMLDSDDEWLPAHLEKRLLFMQENNCDGVFGSYKIYDGENYSEIISRDFIGTELMADYILTTGRAATPTHFYRTECVKKVMWDESLYRHQDYDFSIRFARKFKFIPCKEVTVVVNWEIGQKRQEDFESQIRFIKLHVNSMSKDTYHRYHQNVYKSIADRNDVPKHIKLYFNKERFRFIKFMSFADYLSFQLKELTYVRKLNHRIGYVIKILLAK